MRSRALLRAYGVEIPRRSDRGLGPQPPRLLLRGGPSGLPLEIDGAYHPDQYANPANPEAHERDDRSRDLGADRWEGGTSFVAGVGTGGTVSGGGPLSQEQGLPR